MRRLRFIFALAVAGCLGAVLLPSAFSNDQRAKPKPKPKPHVKCFGKNATRVGTKRPNAILGSGRADVIAAQGGNDNVNGRGGNDLVCGGTGSDMLNGGPGKNRIDGGPGFDTCRGATVVRRCEETRPRIPRTVGAGLAPSDYVTDFFKPRFGFKVAAAGWFVGAKETDKVVDLLGGPNAQTDPVLWFDSTAATTPVTTLVTQIRAVRTLGASVAKPVTLGSVSGQQFTLAVGARITGTVAVPGTTGFTLVAKDRARVYVLSVSGKTVVVIAAIHGTNTAITLKDFLKKADALLTTVAWS